MGRKYSLFDETKTAEQWVEDSRSKVSLDELNDRIDAGWPFATAVLTPEVSAREEQDEPAAVGQAPRSHLLPAFGDQKTIEAWAVDPRCEVSQELLVHRLSRGWSLEKALKTPPYRRLLKGFNEEKPITHWARDSRRAVSTSIFFRRIKEGWTVERALTEPAPGRTQGRISTLFNGFGTSKSLKEWAQDSRCEVSHAQLYARLKNGETIEVAMKRRGRGRPTKSQSVPNRDLETLELEAFGEKKPVSEWLVDPRCRVGYLTLKRNLRLGMSAEIALEFF